MWFEFSLLALIAWAGSDLFSKMGTDSRDKYSHLRLLIFVGAFMGARAAGYLIFTDAHFSPVSILKYLPVSFLYILSMALGYAGLRYIELSVSSPICNSSGAIVSILCFAFLGDRLATVQTLAVILICLGVVLLGVLEKQRNNTAHATTDTAGDEKYRRGALALLFPIAYCIIDALGTFADALVLDGNPPLLTEAEAQLSYEFTFLFVAICAFIYLVFIKKQRFSVMAHKPFIAGAVCETVGQFFYVYALAAKPAAAAPMIASYCVLSVFLSRIVLREKLSRKHYAVISMVFVGIVILGVFDGM